MMVDVGKGTGYPEGLCLGAGLCQGDARDIRACIHAQAALCTREDRCPVLYPGSRGVVEEHEQNRTAGPGLPGCTHFDPIREGVLPGLHVRQGGDLQIEVEDTGHIDQVHLGRRIDGHTLVLGAVIAVLVDQGVLPDDGLGRIREAHVIHSPGDAEVAPCRDAARPGVEQQALEAELLIENGPELRRALEVLLGEGEQRQARFGQEGVGDARIDVKPAPGIHLGVA
ncbi:MAG: hypothetical protein BWZ01_02084 [Deltaproteobacteria bacterium ADurb.BinA179]|nr:MAG: hypothetical protein BWZ01_02084 [Deltaproteobacteria bacterium ADurb.BinA179]